MSKIFTPFIKLWNWIKETAWIQPLLIVGLVFALVFSISPFVNWINGLNSDESSTVSYFEKYQYSLNGILRDDEDKSKAGKLIQNIITATEMAEGDAKAAYVNNKDNMPASKFFLSFVAKECENCRTAKEGFSLLDSEWNKGYYVPRDSVGNQIKDQKFAMASIFSTESVDEDSNYTQSISNPFEKLLSDYPSFFDTASAHIQDTPYFIQNKSTLSSDLESFESADFNNFKVPTILLVDFTETGRNGVSQLMFNVASEGSGSDSSAATAKARTLINCWNGTGDFAFKDE